MFFQSKVSKIRKISYDVTIWLNSGYDVIIRNWVFQVGFLTREFQIPCSNLKNTSTFEGKDSNEVYQIKRKINCNSKMLVYLIECSVCRKQYKSTTVIKFRPRTNNYKSTHCNFWKGQKLSNQARNQKCHYKHYLENDHNGICDWEITIIDHAEKEKF